MKKIVLTFLVIIANILMFSTTSFGANCDYNYGDISENLEDCLSDTPLVTGSSNAQITDGLGDYITSWTNNIALFLGVLAVLGIAVGSFMLVISTGEDDKLKKGKDIIKWSIIGFIAVITSALVINLIIRIMYSSSLNV